MATNAFLISNFISIFITLSLFEIVKNTTTRLVSFAKFNQGGQGALDLSKNDVKCGKFMLHEI